MQWFYKQVMLLLIAAMTTEAAAAAVVVCIGIPLPLLLADRRATGCHNDTLYSWQQATPLEVQQITISVISH